MGLKERLRRSCKLKAACLAATMATASSVGGEAQADTPHDPGGVDGGP